MTELEMMKALEKFDTPTITNVVATYAGNKDVCLSLYDPWTINWYTDHTVRCMYPELGRRCGYAVTAVMGLPDSKFKSLGMVDLFRAIEKKHGPVILVFKQDVPENIRGKYALTGGNCTSAYKAAGVVGVISDGPSRDIDEIRPMGVQYMITGATPGHGDQQMRAINVPVSVASMDVCPGEIIHMDENGAVKFPAEYLPEVLRLATKLVEEEGDWQKKLLAIDGDFEKLIRVWNHEE